MLCCELGVGAKVVIHSVTKRFLNTQAVVRPQEGSSEKVVEIRAVLESMAQQFGRLIIQFASDLGKGPSLPPLAESACTGPCSELRALSSRAGQSFPLPSQVEAVLQPRVLKCRGVTGVTRSWKVP